MEYTSSENNNNKNYENKLSKPELDKSKDQCNNFKSCYARSLSFSKNQSKSLNLSVNDEHVKVNCESSVYNELNNDDYEFVNGISDINAQKKKSQLLIEENRQFNQKDVVNTSYYDSVLLQTQVNTLQWQLKQAESTRQMYQTVLEEVVRFLKKCCQHLNLLVEPWPRSKSEKHIVQNDNNIENLAKLGPMRAQSTLNLHNIVRPSLLEKEFHNFCRAGCNNDNQFNLNLDTEKLSNEAFRLYRTTENLINMRGANLIPILQNKDDVTNVKSHEAISQPNKTYDTFLNESEISRSINLQDHKNKNIDRLSLRSCTTGSIHSNSSTTDEDIQNGSKILPITSIYDSSKHLNTTGNAGHLTVIPNCIDVESGFSSMNSFQEIGLPLVNSTQILKQPNCKSFLISNEESRNESIKTEVQSECKIQRKWSSLPMSSKKTPAPLFEFKCDETLKVLWV